MIKNNNNITSILTIAVIIVATITGISTIALSNYIVFAQNEKFTAKLSGEEEVPAKQTSASGMAWFKPMQDNVWFKINVSNIQGVTVSHIHSGQKGENGPPVLTLFTSDKPSDIIDGTLVEGNITFDMLEGQMKGKQLPDLITEMSNGSTYANVHTEQNPKGEIRGQIITGN